VSGNLADHASLSIDARLIELDHAPVPSSDVVSGSPTVGMADLISANGCAVGIWEITSGIVTDVEVEEVFVVLSGRGRVTFEDDSSILLNPHSVVHLRAGQKASWAIYETLRKVYFLLPDHATKKKRHD
jgi:uncharacterized protein